MKKGSFRPRKGLAKEGQYFIVSGLVLAHIAEPHQYFAGDNGSRPYEREATDLDRTWYIGSVP